MGQNRQWISLDECVNAYIDEAELSNHKYFKLWNLAFRGLNEMGMDSFFAVKSVKLPVNANLTVTLPEDYVNYTKVGVLNQQGEIIPLGVNSKLTSAFDLQPTRLEQTQDDTILTEYDQSGFWWYNYWNGYGMSNLYGVPSGAPFIGSFKIDNANGVIVLSQHFMYDYVMLEYVPSPKPGQEYFIPIQFMEAIIAYIAWKDIRYTPTNRKGSISDKQLREHTYYNELRKAKARYDPINLSDLYEWNLINQRMVVKG